VSRPSQEVDLLRAAAEDVDKSLLSWSLSLSLRERLRACSKAAASLAKFEHVAPEDR